MGKHLKLNNLIEVILVVLTIVVQQPLMLGEGVAIELLAIAKLAIIE